MENSSFPNNNNVVKTLPPSASQSLEFDFIGQLGSLCFYAQKTALSMPMTVRVKRHKEQKTKESTK